MFGILVPRDIDRRVLKEIFREESEPATKDVKYQEGVERGKVMDRMIRLKDSGRA